MKLSERLKELRKEKKLTQKQIAAQLNLPYQNYQRWENGRGEPKICNLEKLGKIFEVPVSYLLCETNVRSFSEIDQILENLPTSYQVQALEYIQELRDKYEKEKNSNSLYSYDVLNQLLFAGHEIAKTEYVRHTLVYWDKKVDYDLAMWINGNSMAPTYQNEEVALIKKQNSIDFNGQVCVVNWDGNSYIKKVYPKKEGLLLRSINTKYQDLLISYDEAPEIIGRVIDSFLPIQLFFN